MDAACCWLPHLMTGMKQAGQTGHLNALDSAQAEGLALTAFLHGASPQPGVLQSLPSGWAVPWPPLQQLLHKVFGLIRNACPAAAFEVQAVRQDGLPAVGQVDTLRAGPWGKQGLTVLHERA